MPRKKAIHFTRGGPRVSCGLEAKKTRADTRVKRRVSCKNCRRVLVAESKP